jgi:hypothetical protein
MSRSPSQDSNDSRMSRRQLIARAASTVAVTGCAALSSGVAHSRDYEDPPSDAAGLTGYMRERQVFVRWNNAVVISYRAHHSLKFPYFGPLVGPVSGASLTTESSVPYPHHRGVWLGCEPLEGGDYWSDGALQDGQIVSAGPVLGRVDETSARIDDQCEWTRQGEPSPLSDRREMTVRIPSDDVYAIEVAIELTARRDIHIGLAKHSFFALRAAADISPLAGGVLMNSKGQVGAAATFGKPAAWCGYHGPRRRSKAVEGIALMNHPDNFGGECPWFTRNYGHLSPSPFNFQSKPWTIPQGETLHLKYCVVLHAGTPQQAGLDTLYTEWLEADGRFTNT